MISVALSKKIITPLKPCPFCGYSRKELSKGHIDDIESNTLLLQINNEDFIIITLDFLFVSLEFVKELKTRIQNKFGVVEKNIIISATHTHSGPAAFELPTTPNIIGEDYVDFLFNMIIMSIKEAKENISPTKIILKKGAISNIYGNRNVKGGIYDNEGFIIKFINNENKIIASLVNISCHPTILKSDTLYLSSDLLGMVRRNLEEEWESPVIITNGACGDTSSRFFTEDSNYEQVVKFGKQIAEDILNFRYEELINLNEFSAKTVEMPIIYTKSDKFVVEAIEKIENSLNLSNEEKNYNDFVLNILNTKFKKGDYKYTLVSNIYTFNNLRIITIPGELVSVLGLKLKKLSEIKNTIIICYANDYVSYIIDKEQYGKYFETLYTRMAIEQADEFIDKIIDSFN